MDGEYINPPQSTRYACNDLCQPRLRICCINLSLEIAAPTKQGSPHTWQLSQAHTGFFQTTMCLSRRHKIKLK